MDFVNEKEKLDCFYTFIGDFKEKDLSTKQNKLIEELKEMLDIIKKLMIDENIDYKFDVDSKYLEVNKDNYIDVVYTYISMVKDAFATYELERQKKLND